MNKQIKICFIGKYSTSFIKKDCDILKKHFDVHIIDTADYKWKFFKGIRVIFTEVKNCDITFSWFADRYAAIAVFFSRVYKKKSIVVAGGYDVAYAPEIKYGAFTKLKEKIPAKYALKKTDLVLAVSKYVEQESLKRVKLKDIKLIYNGVDKRQNNSEKKEKKIVTIGRVTKDGIKLKGLESFAKISKKFPDFQFIIIGPKEKEAEEHLKSINPNLKLTGFVSHDDVFKYLDSAVVYCQLSFIESFGIGTAEAMTCGCIPVVTKRGGLPEVVGDTGFYTEYDNVQKTVDAVKKAIVESGKNMLKSRERIQNNFSIEKREKELVKIIKEQN